MLNREQFFHGSLQHFEPGDELRPQTETGVRQFMLSDEAAGHVYVTNKYMLAKHFGHHVYEVEPHGTITADPSPDMEHSYRAPRATVVRRVGKGFLNADGSY